MIFNAALNFQGVTARESLYIDDCRIEADGAREQGFTSFLIDRSCGETTTAAADDRWTIHNLTQLVEFVQKREQ